MAELKQELPRKGGYAPVEFSRGVPKRGPPGWLMILGGGFIMSVGFAMVVRGNRRRCELRKEQLQARISLLPVLQAESDRRVLQALKENEEEEAQIMKDVKDWSVGESVYNTNKWVTPMPEQIMKM
ncbi:NADH dehydrogenase [ubiquinone] 1 alpha subcomplex subunit 13-like [Actinia tenebrosa]|uniref:NADH dehydrogenase [ubiquinone] 1 alpha subcomplex subunit 13 n=1 Tax=Actinia tenebrosa TaxID=6105 RepID=A0A6P8IF53_ACTTE|nr:NADH dehydrogenase [ubiquinone] 1 alpha subcomplex subunit 13-like [Actinia tenebrosa]